MTKKFDFNWRIPVPEPLLQGNSFDKWTEVSLKFVRLCVKVMKTADVS